MRFINPIWAVSTHCKLALVWPNYCTPYCRTLCTCIKEVIRELYTLVQTGVVVGAHEQRGRETSQLLSAKFVNIILRNFVSKKRLRIFIRRIGIFYLNLQFFNEIQNFREKKLMNNFFIAYLLASRGER